eukprot:353090-Chlamydomonas_euryale.AAC.6
MPSGDALCLPASVCTPSCANSGSMPGDTPEETAGSNAGAAAPVGDEKQGKEECGWCKWMKAGGCSEEFEVWLKCVDDVRESGREDVETCASVVYSGRKYGSRGCEPRVHLHPLHAIQSLQMGPLWECMAKNADYYAPQVEALKEGSSGQEGDNKDVAKPAGEAGASRDPDDVTAEEIEQYLESLDQEDRAKPPTKQSM